MSDSRSRCDECGETLDYYNQKILFIWGRDKKEVLERMEKCISACEKTFDSLKQDHPGLASDYYQKLSNIEDIKNKYYEDNLEHFKKQDQKMRQQVTYHEPSSITIN